MSITRLVLRSVAPLSIFASFALVTQACTGSQEQSVCEQACDCEGCDEGDFNDCVDVLEELKQDTSNEGCENDYQDLLSCLDKKLECDDDDEVDLEDCEDELEEVAECLDDDVLGVAYEEGGGGDRDDRPNDPPAGGTACDDIKACCIAAAELAMVSSASCEAYDTTSEAACQAAIDGYATPPGAEVPPECQFQ